MKQYMELQGEAAKTSPDYLERNDKDMMDFNMFQEVVKEKIIEYLPAEFQNAEVKIHEVAKVNQTLHGLTVRKENSRVAPNIYLEKAYERYRENENLTESLTELADVVVEAAKSVPDEIPVVDGNRFKDNVVLCLVNSTQNEELLKNIPNRSFQDLSVIYRWVVDVNREGMQSAIVTNTMALTQGMTEEELFQHAVENTRRICPPKVSSIQEVMMNMMAEEGMSKEMLESLGMTLETEPEKTLWVMTNEMGINGAVAMLYEDNLHKLAEKVGTDLYVLPSSIHETIAVSVEIGNPDAMAEMVQEINMNMVSLDERLSNNVYHYDKDLRRLELATDVPEKRLDGIVSEPLVIYEKEGPAR